jgi:hypothetical protein
LSHQLGVFNLIIHFIVTVSRCDEAGLRGL